MSCRRRSRRIGTGGPIARRARDLRSERGQSNAEHWPQSEQSWPVKPTPHTAAAAASPSGLRGHPERRRFGALQAGETPGDGDAALEARQALIYHAGINQTLLYEAVVRTSFGVIETSASSLRSAFGKALRDVIQKSSNEVIH